MYDMFPHSVVFLDQLLLSKTVIWFLLFLLMESNFSKNVQNIFITRSFDLIPWCHFLEFWTSFWRRAIESCFCSAETVFFLCGKTREFQRLDFRLGWFMNRIVQHEQPILAKRGIQIGSINWEWDIWSFLRTFKFWGRNRKFEFRNLEQGEPATSQHHWKIKWLVRKRVDHYDIAIGLINIKLIIRFLAYSCISFLHFCMMISAILNFWHSFPPYSVSLGLDSCFEYYDL